MAVRNPVVLAQVIGFGVFLWLGLYLLVRTATRRPLIMVGVLALLTQAAFFASSALTFTTHAIALLVLLERSFWWSAVLPVTAWFHFSVLLVRQLTPNSQRRGFVWGPLVVLGYVVAGVIIVAGTVSDLFIKYNQPVLAGAERFAYLERGPAYPVQIVFIAVCGVAALFNMVRALRSISGSEDAGDRALAQQLRLLVGGAIVFLIGALYIASRYTWNPAVTVLPGYLLLFSGLAVVGYSMAHFGLLLDGQNVQRDFVYSLTGVTLINILYIGLLSLTGIVAVASLLVLVGLVTFTHTLVDNGRNVLDLLFFNKAEQVARAEARDYATTLGTDPVAPPALLIEAEPPAAEPEIVAMPQAEALPELPDEKAFKNLVRKAITNLKSPPQLAKSPLLTLTLVEQRLAQTGQADNRLNRATALRELLIEQIDGLRPTSDETTRVGEAWRFYNVLYYPYVRELSRKGALAEARRLGEERRRNGQREPGELEQVLAWLTDVDEDTFYKWQRRASDTIALLLWEENAKLRAVPQPVAAPRLDLA